MTKRLISIVITICLMFTVMPLNVLGTQQNGGTDPVSEPFKDVEQSAWYYEHVKYAIENGIFNGVGDGLFLPDGTMTRGMYITVLGRMAGIQPVDYLYRDTFSDVDASAYYAPYVVWAVENNITMGIGNGKFDPDGLVTREQMAVFTTRFFDAMGIGFDDPDENTQGLTNGTADEQADASAEGSENKPSDEPKDLSEISDWAKESVLRLWRTGILKGDSNGYFNAKSNASRAEGAAISMRVHQSLVQWNEEHSENSSNKSGDAEGTANDDNGAAEGGQSDGTGGNNSTGSNDGAGSGGDNSSDDDDDDSYTPSYTVNFQTNGGSAINAVSVSHGGSISNLPTPQRMGFVFLGWYKDAAFTMQYTSGSAIYSNLTLHAKYAELESVTSMEDESFALADQDSSLTFTLLSSSAMTSSQVQNAITLARADEIEPEELLVTEGTEASSFILSASDGFTPGAAYTLTLNDDALTFSGREQNFRTCTFTIIQQESDDLPLSSDIIYIPAAELSDIIKNGVEVASLSVPLVSNEEITEINGTFTYADASSLSAGDTLCIYSGNTAPSPGTSSSDLVDTEIAYVAVTGISGTTVSYTEASARNVLALPDTLPIYVGAESPVSNYTAGGTSFTTELAELDFSDFSAIGLDAGTTLDVGDYLFFYTNPDFPDSDDLSEEDIISYAVVNDIALSNNNASVTVTYATVTEEEMREGLSYYARTPVSGELLLGDTDIARLEDSLEQQAMDSGFARDAAVYLSTVAMATNGFEDAAGSRSITVPDLSAVYASAASQQGFSDSVQVRVNASIGTGTRKIGRNGVRAEITVSFEVPVSAGDNEVVISGSATFVEEISISLDASGSPVWDHWWFVYWIKDYNVYSYTNVYNYTGMFIEAHISSQGGGVSLDVSDEIQELLTSTDSEEIISGAGDLLDAYCDLIQGGSDWIELFEQNIFEKRIPVLFGIIQIKISADFVVSAYINVALGTDFEYSDGTCYAFYGGIFARNFRSYTIKLADEVFTFRFYTLGELGIRAGIRLELAVGLFNCDWNSVGFTAEVGVYGKLYGYFYYEYTAVNGVSSSLSTGALYFELGIYLEINFVAQVMSGVVSSSWTLYENEWPLLYAGSRYSTVDFLSNETPEIRLKDENKSFSLPESFRIMKTLDLREGFYSTLTYPLSDFNITFTDASFSMIGNEVVVTPGINVHVLDCSMTITWRHGTLAISSLPISRTYHIHWDNVDENGYRLSFDSLGGTLVNSISGLYDQPIIEPTPPVKTGYSFAGWYSDNTYSQEFTFSTMPAENIRLYAKWEPNHNTPYVVYHYRQDLANESSYTLADTERLTGTTNTLVTPGTKSYTGFMRPDTRSMIIAPDGSASISYYYTRKSYYLTVDARFTASSDPLDDYKPGDDPSEVSDYLKTIMVKYGARVSIPSFSRNGWYIYQWSPAIQQDMTMPANNLSFTATWVEGTYTLTLDANGGSVEPASKTVVYLHQYGGLPIPTRAGCTFSGWYPSEDEEDNAYGTRVTSDTVKIPGSHTFYAKWQPRDFTVTFDTNGGDLETDTKTVTYLSRYGDLPIPVSPGFTFLGWYLSEDEYGNGTGTQVQEDSIVDIPDDHTLYAMWDFTVTFDTNGGDLETDTKTVTYLSRYADLPIPVSPGFTFLGWYLSEDEYGNATGTQAQEDSIVGISHDHTLYAGWELNDDAMYTVRHHLQTAPGSDEYTLHETETSYWPAGGIVPIHHKSIAGYIGVGGYPPPLTVLEDGSASVDLYYNIQSYSLYYFDGSGDFHALQFQSGAPITPPENPQKTGFRFTGWEPEIPETMPMSDVTVMPTYEKKTYTITLSAPDAVPPYSASATVEYEGTTVTDIVYPERPGFVFTGWNTPEGNLLIDTNGAFHYMGSNSAYLTPREDGTCYWVYDGDITLEAGWDDCSVVNSFEELQSALANPEVGNIVVTNTLIVPNGSVIDGGGRTLYFRNGNRLNSIFELYSTSSCTLKNMTIDFGGNVGMNARHAIVMENVTLKNAITYAFMNNSSALLRSCSITGSQGNNGVIFSQGETLTMTNCSVHDNAGDGINCSDGTLTIDGGSVTGNSGRGIRNYGGQVLLNNCTIANNGGDGIYTTYGATKAVNVTVAGNARGSVTDSSGEATFVNSVLVDNIGEYGDVTMDAINTSATLINCLTGDIYEYQHVLTDCISVSKQTVFHSYESGKPVLIQLADGSWAARLSADSAALTGGCSTYFSTDHGSAAYGSTPVYIKGSEGATRVTTYQGGGARMDGVIGAYNQ